MPEEDWAALGEKVEPHWGMERAQAARAAIEQRGNRRRAAARLTVAASSLALAGVAVFALLGKRPSTATDGRSNAAPSTTASAAPDPAIETLTVTHLSSDTVLDALPDRAGRGFALRSGGARFSVPHDAKRPFVVIASDVTIEDLGTTFTVRYLTAERLDIAVEEGRVRVRANATHTEVGPGETLEVPVSPPIPDREEAALRSSSNARTSWRPLAERGRYDEAHTALEKAGPNAVRDVTADLLLAADAARLSGHPADALPYLQRVVHAHASDPRSGLASFTLGRVLLDELGRPREAADAFARARAAGGPLAEDALAREVEALSRAGDPAKSRELADTYRRLYPNGRRVRAVSRFGGLD